MFRCMNARSETCCDGGGCYVGNTVSTPQASCGHISIVRSILSASPCAVPTSSHMDWCLSELRIRIFSRTIFKCFSRTV